MRYSMIFTFILFSVSLSLGQDISTLKLKGKEIKLTSPLDRLTIPNKKHYKSQAVIKQPQIFNAEKLPIFCKIEHKMAKSSKINVMMRLGTLDYVNKLEGKN